ncbi:MAG: SNF2-related protein [Acidimicrobiia bacterium]
MPGDPDRAPDLPLGRPGTADLKLPGTAQATTVAGLVVEPGDAAEALVEHAGGPAQTAFGVWARAAAVLVEMVARGRFLPTARREGSGGTSVSLEWVPLLDTAWDRRRRSALAKALPTVGHCGEALDAVTTLDRFWAHACDSLVRRAAPQPQVGSGWEADLLEHLTSYGRNRWEAPTEALAGEILAWLAPPAPQQTWTGRLTLHDPPDVGPWWVDFDVVSDDDADMAIPANEVWAGTGTGAGAKTAALRRALSVAAQIAPQIAAAAHADYPARTSLDVKGAWAFLAAVRRGGLPGAVLVAPPDLDPDVTAARLRLVAGDGDRGSDGDAALGDVLMSRGLAELSWEAVVGGRTLDEDELSELISADHPLVLLAGRWVAFDPLELERLRDQLRSGPPPMSPGEVVAAVLAGEMEVAEALGVEVAATGDVARVAKALQGHTLVEIPEPAGFEGTLRPYQKRALDWLMWLSREGLGGCLADDMGLGKTVVALALMLAHKGRTLVVCPASVLGNWQHETARFAPGLRVVAHHGPDRARALSDLEALGDDAVVVTTYAVLRRDADLLAGIPWHRVVLDEAQHMKNTRSETARAARRVGTRARQRLALTGTPIENRLLELWSILDFANPGVLGGLGSFRSRFVAPVERRGDQAAAARLKRVAAPFVLRRRKSDPEVLAGLPAKHEAMAYCGLTEVQAALYREAVDVTMARVRSAGGITRRGHVLALLTRLKQICDHPLLVDPGIEGGLVDLSSKLSLLAELVDEVRSEGDRSLVFTQYIRMGELISAALGGVPFLHGGLALAKRDALVESFQHDPNSPDVLVVSLRAGGVGLNLTAANRVFHYDRWWNPAVEDQATDRTHRIGQSRDVWVHKLVCMGTLEEHIDAVLQRKRGLVDAVLASGETFLTELEDDELAALVALEDSAVVR